MNASNHSPLAGGTDDFRVEATGDAVLIDDRHYRVDEPSDVRKIIAFLIEVRGRMDQIDRILKEDEPFCPVNTRQRYTECENCRSNEPGHIKAVRRYKGALRAEKGRLKAVLQEVKGAVTRQSP